MLDVAAKRLLLRPEDVPASCDDLEVVGVFNPGVVRVEDRILLLVRVAERPRQHRAGFCALPRAAASGQTVIDWVAESDVEPIDARVVRLKSTGRVRLTFLPHLRLYECTNDLMLAPVASVGLFPQEEWEEFGVEDPRITPIDGRYWITYVAVSRHGVATALASTADFRTFERHGILFPPENKDVVIFPERIDGAYVALHRPSGSMRFSQPAMWLARSPDGLHWGRHRPVYHDQTGWATGKVGAGTPPIRFFEGWITFYHGNITPAQGTGVGSYCAGAFLLDAGDPARIVRATAGPILTATEPFERVGFLPEIVFPTGIVTCGDALLVFYGAADACTAVVSLSANELAAALVPLTS